MSDTVTVSKADIVKLCEYHANVAGVRMGDTMDEIDYSHFRMHCRLLKEHQEAIGIQVVEPAKMDRFLKAFAPEEPREIRARAMPARKAF